MPKLKPIQTRYKGYRFRSRLEAQWAVFYDALRLRWFYELQGYDLGGGLTYLPDFFFPELNFWIEIKAQWPTEVESEKAERLAKQSGQRVYIFFGGIPYLNGSDWETSSESALVFYSDWGGDNYQWWCECPVCGKLGIAFCGSGERICGEKCNAPHGGLYHSTPRLQAAYEKARGARFEHGERPG